MKAFLELCCDLESRTANIYRELACRESLARETRGLFARLAAEESRHARSLSEQMSHLRTGAEGISCDRAFPQLLVRRAEEIYALAQAASISDLKAVSMMKGAEMRLWDFHLANVLAFQSPELKELFTLLAQEEREHILLLGKHFMTLTEGETPSVAT